MRKSRIGEKTFSTFLLAILGLVALVTTSFAWYGVSRIPFISDLNLSIMSDCGLLVAPDVNGQPGTWSSYLDISDYFTGTASLRPTTYLDGQFYQVKYDLTGRTNGVELLPEKNYNTELPEGLSAQEIYKFMLGEGCMVYFDFWLSGNGYGADVFLAEGNTNSDGTISAGTYVVGQPKWDAEKLTHINSGYGTETAVRVGFLWQKTDVNGNPIGDSTFMMYEPNANTHTHEKDGVLETKNVEGDALINSANLIRQKAYTWTEKDPLDASGVNYQIGEFIQNPQLLRVEKLGYVKIRLYVWLEGQDVDCYARSVADEVTILGSFSFKAGNVKEEGTGIGRRDLSEINKD